MGLGYDRFPISHLGKERIDLGIGRFRAQNVQNPIIRPDQKIHQPALEPIARTSPVPRDIGIIEILGHEHAGHLAGEKKLTHLGFEIRMKGRQMKLQGVDHDLAVLIDVVGEVDRARLVTVLVHGHVPVVGRIHGQTIGLLNKIFRGLQPTGLEIVNQFLLFVAEAKKGIGTDVDRSPVGGGPGVVEEDRAGIRIAPVIGLRNPNRKGVVGKRDGGTEVVRGIGIVRDEFFDQAGGSVVLDPIQVSRSGLVMPTMVVLVSADCQKFVR